MNPYCFVHVVIINNSYEKVNTKVVKCLNKGNEYLKIIQK